MVDSTPDKKSEATAAGDKVREEANRSKTAIETLMEHPQLMVVPSTTTTTTMTTNQEKAATTAATAADVSSSSPALPSQEAAAAAAATTAMSTTTTGMNQGGNRSPYWSSDEEDSSLQQQQQQRAAAVVETKGGNPNNRTEQEQQQEDAEWEQQVPKKRHDGPSKEKKEPRRSAVDATNAGVVVEMSSSIRPSMEKKQTSSSSRRRLVHVPPHAAAAALAEPRGLGVLTTDPSTVFQPAPAPTTTLTPPPVSSLLSSSKTTMTDQDIEICQRLDQEYERALEEREIGFHARYDSVRQTAGFSIAFMFLYMLLGTIFFTQAAGWQVREALFFSIYTITTVGYGSGKTVPKSPGFQLYTIFYILIGVATLTVMVAQVYQCLALEASRAQHARDKAELARRSRDLVSDGLLKTNASQHSSTGSLAIQEPQQQQQQQQQQSSSQHGSASMMEDIIASSSHEPATMWWWMEHKCLHLLERCRRFFRHSQHGRGLSVLIPLTTLVALGAAVVGPIEGWTVVESIYFAVVSLTTVGYGDTVPEKPASIWFSIFWLPFSVGFMSLYLGNVARFYIRLSDKNIQRLERHMRRQMQRNKDAAERERREVLRRALRGQDTAAAVSMGTTDEEDVVMTDKNGETNTTTTKTMDKKNNASHKSKTRLRLSGFEPLPAQELSSSNASDAHELDLDSPEALEILGQQRRERILQESDYALQMSNNRVGGQTMTTMRDIVQTVRRNVVAESSVGSSYISDDTLKGPESQFMSIKSTYLMSHSAGRRITLNKKKPSFALRVLVQERFAQIIATEIAGFQSNMQIEDDTLSVTIETLKRTADKWLIPRRARKAFRSVAFEALYFVGEHGLVTRGADALFDLTPFEFHSLFSPLLAAFGDAETMEGWLATTNVLAEVDLRGEEAASAAAVTQDARQEQDGSMESDLSSSAEATANMLAPESIQHPSTGRHGFRSALAKSSKAIT